MINTEELREQMVEDTFNESFFKQITSIDDNTIEEDIAESLEPLLEQYDNMPVSEAENYDDSEILDAILCEAITDLDSRFVTSLAEKAKVADVYELDGLQEDSRIGLSQKLEEMISAFEGGKTFVLLSPLVTVLMQSEPDASFAPNENAWRGKSMTSLTGKLTSEEVEADVYTYLFGNDTESVIIGNYNEEAGGFTSSKLTIKNISFA